MQEKDMDKTIEEAISKDIEQADEDKYESGPIQDPSLEVVGSIRIDLLANGKWQLQNALNNEPLSITAVHDLLATITEAYHVEVITESVLAKFKNKLGGM